MTHVQFSQDWGGFKAGTISDEMIDGVADALIKAGQATRSDPMSYLRASYASETKKLREEMPEMLKTLVSEIRGSAQSKGPPTGGGQVDFNAISNGTPAEEQDKDLCLTEAMRCMFVMQSPEFATEKREYARKRLRNYSDEHTVYTHNERGDLVETTTRGIPGGGIETVTRTGTDSLSGGPTYGFTLKPNYVGNLFKIAREAEVFAGDTRPVPVSQGNETIWPALDQMKAPTVVNGIPQAAVFGGITMSFVGETTARNTSDAATYENRFKVDDLTGITDFSRDYIVDNYIAMDSEVNTLFGQAVGWLKDWTYIRGDGIAKPQGYFNANAAIIGGPNSSARYNSNQISSDDLSWMLSHLATQCWGNSRWLANVTSFPQLYILQNHSGTPVFQPNAMIDQAMMLSLIKGSSVDEAQLVSAPMGMLLGRPIYFTEKVPILGTTGDISLVCPRQYGDATKAGLEVGVSDHFYFSTDRIVYRFKLRYFGRSLWRAPYIQADNLTTPGSGTQVSPFVLLHS